MLRESFSATGTSKARPLVIENFEGAEAILLSPKRRGFDYVVSIGEPRSRKPRMLECVPHKLRLEFDDVTYGPDKCAEIGYRPPMASDIQKLVEFLRTVKGPLLCHCAAGVSRSAAAAAIFVAMHTGPGQELQAMRYVEKIRPIAFPNKRMIGLADRILGRGGKLLEASYKHFPQSEIDVVEL